MADAVEAIWEKYGVPGPRVVGVGEEPVAAVLGVGDVAGVEVEGGGLGQDQIGGGDRVVGRFPGRRRR